MLLLDSANMSQSHYYGSSPGSDYGESHFHRQMSELRRSPYPGPSPSMLVHPPLSASRSLPFDVNISDYSHPMTTNNFQPVKKTSDSMLGVPSPTNYPSTPEPQYTTMLPSFDIPRSPRRSFQSSPEPQFVPAMFPNDRSPNSSYPSSPVPMLHPNNHSFNSSYPNSPMPLYVPPMMPHTENKPSLCDDDPILHSVTLGCNNVKLE